MNVFTKEEDNKVIFSISGSIDIKTYELFNAEILKAINEKKIDIILDLGSVDYISGSGIKALLKLRYLLSKIKGNLVLLGVSEDIKYIFKDTKLNYGFPFANTLSEAKKMKLSDFLDLSSIKFEDIKEEGKHIKKKNLKKENIHLDLSNIKPTDSCEYWNGVPGDEKICEKCKYFRNKWFTGTAECMRNREKRR